MAVGIIISMLVSAVIGFFSKNQMSATSVTVPVMIIFSFLPMLAMFNETTGETPIVFYTAYKKLAPNTERVLLFTVYCQLYTELAPPAGLEPATP